MHLLGKCSELVYFWVMLAQFSPSGGKKTTENRSKCWFLSVIWKSVPTSSVRLLVSDQKWFILGDVGPILAF